MTYAHCHQPFLSLFEDFLRRRVCVVEAGRIHEDESLISMVIRIGCDGLRA